jgi:outer membrane protein OmpA-like peptidoglycan-associated protein
VEVVGFGDATDSTPQVQAEGVDLALARARAMAAALNAAGVPPSAIRMSAQADGRGGAARLID